MHYVTLKVTIKYYRTQVPLKSCHRGGQMVAAVNFGGGTLKANIKTKFLQFCHAVVLQSLFSNVTQTVFLP